ncbi:ketoacyl-ACP synthase III [Danxiaibacter flavus]|uniref:Ketoacyl-ACP synthase III n=1 Tax=Danxiaibacter flavus TaxID=3049108 RepID=A0ABV3ZFZ1_9BACT|nr:ketoacyl-ACP synthase III [Chitinophagaceae bacterium DXS]
MNAKIVAISYWLPDQKLTNEEINKLHPEWSVEKIASKTGIYERRIANENISTVDMAYYAVERMFSENNIDKSVVDFILLCTQSPDYFLPSSACVLQNRLGLSTSVGALDFNLGCSGYVYGLGLAKGLIASGSAKNVLLVTSETYSKLIHPDDKSNKTIFGDAAAATLISSDEMLEGLSIGNFVYGTDGKGADNLIVKNGGFGNKHIFPNRSTSLENDQFSSDDYLYMNGAEIFKFTSQNVPELVDSVLKANNTSDEEVDMYIFHQANKYMLDFIRKKMHIPESKFFYFLETCGNTVSSTIPISLSEAFAQRKVSNKSKILLAGFGVGYSWAGCILE